MKSKKLWVVLLACLLLSAVPGCGGDDDDDAPIEGDEAGECNDGVDNDQDGNTDCADDGCAAATACTGDDDDTTGDDDDTAGDDDDSAGDDDDSAGDDDTAGDDDSTNASPTGVPVVSVTPALPTRYDDLQCALHAGVEDPDDDIVLYAFSWHVDGVDSGITTTLVPASATLPYEQWSCFVTPYDGIAWGQAGSASVTIVNTPPGAPTVTITPSPAQPEEDLVCSVSVDSLDSEGDPVTYSFAWQVGGVDAGVTSATVPASSTTEGEEWTCIVTPNDGTDDGTAGQASVQVGVCLAPVSLVPVLTSNTGPNGLSVSASSSNGCGTANCNYWEPWKAFNGTTNAVCAHNQTIHDNWFSGGVSSTRHFPQWLMVDLGAGSAAFLDTLELYSGTQSGYTNSPTSYQIQGSNDASAWDLLVDVSNDYSLVGPNLTTSHTVQGVTAYRYYRIYVTDADNNQYDEVKISELTLYGCLQ